MHHIESAMQLLSQRVSSLELNIISQSEIQKFKEDINLKANKASVANALHRKANKLELSNI
jgi:hypothetical protein